MMGRKKSGANDGIQLNPINGHYDTVASDDESIIMPEEKRSDPDNVVTLEVKALNRATWASSFLNLASTIVGAGILGIPFAISLTGWGLGILLLCLCATLSFLGLHLLYECALRVPTLSSYNAVATLTVPRLNSLVDILITIKGIGVATSYLVVVGDSLPLAFASSHSVILTSRFWSIVLSYLIILPLSYFPSLDSLRFSSLFSAFSILLLIMVIVLYALPTHDHTLDPCPHHHDRNTACGGSIQAAANSLSSVLHAFPIMLFTFSCQQNAFTVVNELQRPTAFRVNSMFAASVGTALFVALLVGLTGYSTYGSETKSDILSSYPKNGLTGFCRVLIALVVSCHYPLQLHPARRTALSVWQRLNGQVEVDAVVYRRRFIIFTVRESLLIV